MINQLKKILLAGVIITSISNHICAAEKFFQNMSCTPEQTVNLKNRYYQAKKAYEAALGSIPENLKNDLEHKKENKALQATISTLAQTILNVLCYQTVFETLHNINDSSIYSLIGVDLTLAQKNSDEIMKGIFLLFDRLKKARAAGAGVGASAVID